jgi:hypothetical protein
VAEFPTSSPSFSQPWTAARQWDHRRLRLPWQPQLVSDQNPVLLMRRPPFARHSLFIVCVLAMKKKMKKNHHCPRSIDCCDLRLVLTLLIDQDSLLFELSAPSHGEQQNSRRNFARDSSLTGFGVPQLHVSASGWLACNAKAALHVTRQFGPMA